MGEYIVTARRSGDEWWIGGITDWTPRDMKVDLSFIPGIESATIEVMADGANAHRNGRDYSRTVTTGAKLGASPTVHLAPGGGFAMRITPRAADLNCKATDSPLSGIVPDGGLSCLCGDGERGEWISTWE